MRVSVVIPARNEADRIRETIRALLQSQPKEVTVAEIIVVDDASEDETSKVAREAGATKVLRLQRRSGKGAALRQGLAEASSEVVLFMDADLGATSAALWQLVFPVLKGEADMTIAAPPPDPAGGGFGFVKTFAAWAIRKATGFQPAAPLSGQRAVRRTLLDKVTLADGYGVETALTIDALRMGYRVVEVPIPFGHRALGKSLRGFLHRARQFWDIFWAVLPRLLIKRHRS